MSIFGPLVVTGDDVRTAQARLLATAQGVDNDVQNCGSLDAVTRADWGLFYITVVDAVKQGPGWWADMDQTSALQATLYGWQQKLGKVCALSIPVVDPNAPSAETSTVMQLARYATIAAVVVGGAYVVGQVAPAFIERGRK